jgi:hypothetical protein
MRNPFYLLKKTYGKPDTDIAKTLKGMGVKWVKAVDPYNVDKSRRLFRIQDEDVFWITDFFKPELDELYGILPSPLGRLFDSLLSKYGFSFQASLNTNHVFCFFC